MKKKLIVLTVLVTLFCSSMTVSAQTPDYGKPEFLMKLSAETADLYGKIDHRYNEVDELVAEEYYAGIYPDLKLAFGEDNYVDATKHYLEYGYAENREWKIEIGSSFSFGDSGSPSATQNPAGPSPALKEREDYPNGDYVIREFENDLLSI